MVVEQTRVHVNLKQDGMFISRKTWVSVDLGLSCGSLLEAAQIVSLPITIERCQLTASEFQAWRKAQGLAVATCAERYGLTPKEVERYESLGRFVE